MIERDEVIARLERMLARMVGFDRDANEQFESDADEFYRATGYMLPGKSVPMEMATHSYEETRRKLADEWWAARREDYKGAIASAIRLLRAPAEEGETR